MIRVVRAELYKMRTTPGLWILLGVTLVLTALGIITAFFVTPGTNNGHFGAPTSVPDLRLLVGAGYLPATFLAPVLGVLCITTEYRQKVISITFLVTPRRAQVVLAKVAASIIWGVVLGLASLALVAAMGLPLFESQGGHFATLAHQIAPVVPGLLGAYALLAVFGVGVGTLLRNQVGAVVFVLALTLLIEPIIVLLVRHIFHADLNWFPSRATEALAGGLTRSTGNGNDVEGALLNWWLGGLALLAWGAGTAAVGYLTTFRRDVT